MSEKLIVQIKVWAFCAIVGAVLYYQVWYAPNHPVENPEIAIYHKLPKPGDSPNDVWITTVDPPVSYEYEITKGVMQDVDRCKNGEAVERGLKVITITCQSGAEGKLIAIEQPPK